MTLPVLIPPLSIYLEAGGRAVIATAAGVDLHAALDDTSAEARDLRLARVHGTWAHFLRLKLLGLYTGS